ncbi:Uncharacterized protein TCM_029909 [Theobroma cacao]|uniref:Uncharacterized protein n=1 Tax=Theobroma cacao TaxID=3641 RepID=A0A061GFG1_THECC|nr:Uncharacterized protein TCM_029909 [Theobroma cacao]
MTTRSSACALCLAYQCQYSVTTASRKNQVPPRIWHMQQRVESYVTPPFLPPCGCGLLSIFEEKNHYITEFIICLNECPRGEDKMVNANPEHLLMLSGEF